jgi:uncharacterized protein (TIGR02246 family)
MDQTDRAGIDEVLAELQAAWAAGDAGAFGAVFADDVVFVNILGQEQVGRRDVAVYHETTFATVYRGTHLELGEPSLDEIAPGIVLARLEAWVVGEGWRRATHAMMLLMRDGRTWTIRAFHNMVPFQPAAG